PPPEIRCAALARSLSLGLLAFCLLVVIGLVVLWESMHSWSRGAAPSGSRQRAFVPASPERSARRGRPKPAWVVGEVIRLKALMPTASVRTVATTFNTLWRAKRGETVGKTWVAKVIAAHRLEIVRKRAEIKQRRPWPMEKNRVWALDLTYLPDS